MTESIRVAYIGGAFLIFSVLLTHLLSSKENSTLDKGEKPTTEVNVNNIERDFNGNLNQPQGNVYYLER